MNSIVVKDMDINIQLGGRITAIVGPTNSGKTTFLKKLCNKVDNSQLMIDEVSIKEYDITFLRNNIVVVFDDNHFNCEYVAEELYYNIHKLGYRIDEITDKIENLANRFKFTDILDRRIDELTLNEKILIKILSYLIINPKILAIDNLFVYLDNSLQKELLKYVAELGISLVIVTSDPEFLLICDDIVVMNNYKAIICAPNTTVLTGNSILPYLGLKLPFIVELSQNLILYQLVDKVYLDKRKLVDKLWK